MSKTLVRRVQSDLTPLPGYCELMTRLYRARGISDVSELDRRLQGMLPYHDLQDIDTACARLYQAVVSAEKIVIVGDYDADGATSTALVVKALRRLGCDHIDYIVPNRFDFGYGLSPAIVKAASVMSPKLLITVDNGIVSHEGVEQASALGIDVIITDHHLQGESLPAAVAVVNPNRKDDGFASKNLAGVGVSFYLMIALRAYLREKGWFSAKRAEPNLSDLLDLVALGTVADLVLMDKNNRLLVHQGINRIQSGKSCPGIAALIEVSGKSKESMSASDLGFALGPRLNAAGRLDDMRIGVECLLANSVEEAMPLAQTLNDLNIARRDLEKTMKKDADLIVSSTDFKSSDASGLCLYQKDWHQGVVGLVASRIKDSINRPVIAFAKANDESAELKGSGRSIKSLNIRDILAEINAENQGLILKFGGHAMAAGLSIKESDYSKFSKLFNLKCADKISGRELIDSIETDGPLQHDQFNLEVADQLIAGGPWGQGFPEPLFDGVFNLIDQNLVGDYHLKMVLQPLGSSMIIEAIAFYIDLKRWPNRRCKEVIVAYRLGVNRYCGRSKLQLMVEYFTEK